MSLNKPFTVTTTIVTTVYPDRVRANREDGMEHSVTMETDDSVEIPVHLLHGVTQAACEHTMEALMETGIGVEGEVVEEDETRCNVGNLMRLHRGNCSDECRAFYRDEDDVIDVECVEVAA